GSGCGYTSVLVYRNRRQVASRNNVVRSLRERSSSRVVAHPERPHGAPDRASPARGASGLHSSLERRPVAHPGPGWYDRIVAPPPRRIMSDTPAPPGPWYQDGLAFTCTRCGKCCTGEPGFVWVTDDELAAI